MPTILLALLSFVEKCLYGFLRSHIGTVGLHLWGQEKKDGWFVLGGGENMTEIESLGSRLSLEIAEKVCQSSDPSQVGRLLQAEESKRDQLRMCYL